MVSGAATVAVWAVTASADHGDLQVGLRTGWAKPTGTVGSFPAGAHDGYPEEYVFPSGIPLWFDAGYRLSRRLYIGAYFQTVAFSGCTSDVSAAAHASCSSTDVQLGTTAEIHLGGGWFGFFAGYEGGRSFVDKSGFGLRVAGEDVGMQGGFDWNLGGGWTLGPFASGSIGACTRRARARTPSGAV